MRRQFWLPDASGNDKPVATRENHDVRHASLDDIAAFLAARLREPLPGPNAQRRFAPVPLPEGWSPDDEPATAQRAAAVVLLYPGVLGPALALTERRADLPHHPGQISLPGGRLMPGESARAAALREADEEIGVPADAVDILGALSPLWIPVSNFILHPFVGVARERPVFAPHPGEVAALVEAPLDRLLDRGTIGWTTRDRRGETIDFPYFNVGGATVWGATAMVLSEFVCLWDADHGPGRRVEPR
jgi:8-oxo-dGTP pyrophosphatase MutT (NUDIX family)